MVTSEPVLLGHSCRVQFIMEEVTPDDEFFAPDFAAFKITMGPDVSAATDGNTGGFRKLRNISYVLTPQKKGNLEIPSAMAIINGKTYYTIPAFIKVISPEEAREQDKKQTRPGGFNSSSYLAPGEDPAAKINRGLFLKATVDRQSCYVGQPVTATFKLYSRLYSKSDIVKNPGFYGFTVLDVIGLKNKKVATEEIDGLLYDVHTVRTVQLYPLNEGEYEVDPMEVRSKVDFSLKAVDTDPEQTINEGVYKDDSDSPPPGWIRFEHEMKSEPLMISVKPLPAKGKPDNWTGAVGRFTVNWKIVEASPAANEEAHLELVVQGKGNFSQLTPPVIKWPAGIEGFEPRVVDEWDITKKPLQGFRKFIYPFVASRKGLFTIPAFSFSYFNTDSNKYNSYPVAALAFDISRDKNRETIESNPVKKQNTGSHNPAGLYIAIIVTLVIAGVFIMWRRESRRERMKPPPPPPPVQRIPIEDFLRPAAILTEGESQQFYAALNQGIWQYLGDRLHVSGTQMNKTTLRHLLSERISQAQLDELLTIIETCEAGIYTVVDAGNDKEAMLHSAMSIMQGIEQRL